MQGGAIYSSNSGVLLVQTTLVSNTPADYAGSTFTHRCYGGFYHNVSTANCDQCAAGTYKNFILNPDARVCNECPEVLYLYSLCTVSILTMCCRAGTAISLSPRSTSHTVQSAQPATTDQAPAHLPAKLAQLVGTGNSLARRARHALPSALQAFLQRAHRELRAPWLLSSGFTWQMLRLRSRDRAPRASLNQA
jgi:hypothetical protein